MFTQTHSYKSEDFFLLKCLSGREILYVQIRHKTKDEQLLPRKRESSENKEEERSSK